jgi:cytidine deaminase
VSSDLLDAARAVMQRAYAPYSNFRVGVAVRAPDGSIHVGANVENAAYPQGWCAETSAIGALIAAGHTEIAEVAVIGTGDEPCVPCGGCRQRLREFMALSGNVLMVAADSGTQDTRTLEQLLPHSFGPEFLP